MLCAPCIVITAERLGAWDTFLYLQDFYGIISVEVFFYFCGSYERVTL